MTILWAVPGIALGLVNTWMQWWTTTQLHPDKPGAAIGLVLGGALLRLLIVVVMIWVSLQVGLAATLAVVTGWFVARWGSLIYFHRQT